MCIWFPTFPFFTVFYLSKIASIFFSFSRVISTWHMHLFSLTPPLPAPTLHYLSTPFGLLFTKMGGKDKKCNLAFFFPQSHLILKNNMLKLVNLLCKQFGWKNLKSVAFLNLESVLLNFGFLDLDRLGHCSKECNTSSTLLFKLFK